MHKRTGPKIEYVLIKYPQFYCQRYKFLNKKVTKLVTIVEKIMETIGQKLCKKLHCEKIVQKM